MSLFKRLVFVLLSLSTPLYAQEQKGILVKGKKVTATIAAGQQHIYQVHLEKNQFALVRIVQHGADVKVNTYDQKGRPIGEFDGANGNSGPEEATLISVEKASYRISVTAQWTGGDRPYYELTLATVRSKAANTAGRIDELMAAFDDPRSPGAAVAVLKGGKLVFEKAYGMADLEHHIPLRTTTPQQIGSITKSFTNYCMFLLEKAGKLSMDDDIRQYIPELPDFGHRITLRQISQHTSGLRDYATLRGMARYEIDTWEMFFKMLARQHDLNFVPGEDVLYSNTGCTLFAVIIQRLSGQSYAQFVKQHIFDPLGMQSSAVQTEQGQLLPGIAASYDRTANGPKKLYVLGDLYGGTGVISTARDMAIWAKHLLHPKTNADIIHKMASPGKLNDGTLTTFGSGLMIADHQGHLELGHSGAVAGFKAHVGIFPDDDIAVVYLANNNDVNSRPIARQIAELYFSSKGKTSTARKLVSAASQKTAPAPEPVDKSQLVLSEYTGLFYSDEVPTSYWFKVIDGQLVIQPGYNSDMKLTPESKDRFSGAFDGTVEFSRDSLGHISGCRFTFPRMRNLYFRKLPVN
ncbi:serine hydrolase domain-containing protein [Mucilaginibacter gynuensis]